MTNQPTVTPEQKRHLAAIRKLLAGDEDAVVQGFRLLVSLADPAFDELFEGSALVTDEGRVCAKGELELRVKASHRKRAALELLALRGGLTPLTKLHLEPLSDLAVLATASSVESLRLERLVGGRLDGIEALMSLKTLYVESDAPMDVSPLAARPHLEVLDASYCNQVRWLDATRLFDARSGNGSPTIVLRRSRTTRSFGGDAHASKAAAAAVAAAASEQARRVRRRERLRAIGRRLIDLPSANLAKLPETVESALESFLAQVTT